MHSVKIRQMRGIVMGVYAGIRRITTSWFLADRTNGCAIGTVYNVASVCRRRLSVCTECIVVAKRCILEQKLLSIESLQEVVYEKSIGTKMNDLDLRLEVVSRSCQPLRDIRR